MAKAKNPRRVADNEARAKLRMIRTSPQKLNLVAQLIRGKKVEKALADLEFSHKRISHDVKKCLESAIANAENNHGCLLYTSPSPRDRQKSRMPSSA